MSHLQMQRRNIITFMTEEAEETESEEEASEVEAEVEVEVEDDASEEEKEEEEEEEEEEKEDPEITAIKEEIAVLEKELKSKRSEATRKQDLADEYTERGYQRKCAEMDNMRRMRSAASTASKASAKANIIKSFLPNLDYLREIADETYADNEFAKSYKALKNDFENALKGMDLTDFTVDVGSQVDRSRCTVVEEEVSNEYSDADVILRVNKIGYEVSGQIIRMAEVVVSKGEEVEENEEEVAAEAAEEEVNAEEEVAAEE